jgi:hypothetical protein
VERLADAERGVGSGDHVLTGGRGGIVPGLIGRSRGALARRGALIGLLSMLVLAGCGGGGGADRTAPAPAGGAGGAGESAPGGAGDENPIRVPATFTFRDGRLEPSRIEVPAFLAIELAVVSNDGRPHAVTVEARGRRRLLVPPGGRASLRLSGLRPGRYRVVPDGAAEPAVLVAGADAGP